MTELTIAVRFLHLAASILALGIFTFLCFIARPAVHRAGGPAQAVYARFRRRQWRILTVAVAVMFVSAAVGLILQAAVMSGRPVTRALTADILGAALSTQYGRVWLLRQVLLIVLAIVGAFLIVDQRRGKTLEYFGFAVAACALMALAASGHAAAGEGVTLALQLAADGAHLLAAGMWAGALVPLALLLSAGRGEPAWHRVAQEATRRFSWLGIGGVTALVAAGAINGWKLVNGVAPLFGTAYGRLLLLKLGLLFPLLAFAAMNLLRLRPRLLRTPPRAPAFGRSLTVLRCNTLAEVALAAVILVIVAVLGVTPPARHVPPDWPFPFRFSWDVARSIDAQWTRLAIGGGIAAFAVVPLAYALFIRRGRRWAVVAGLVAIAGGAAVALPALAIDAYPTTFRRPAVPYHAISVANGVQLYREHCAGCHGAAGFGDGPAGAVLEPKPADLTAKHTGDHTAGDLFWWLTHGKDKTAMPGFKDRISEEERWDLINFVRALSAAEQARSMAPLLERAWLVAPDLLYRSLRDENHSLKEHRGRSIVLLVLFTWPQSQARLAQLSRLHARLAGSGVEVLAVPRDPAAGRAWLARAPFTVVTDGAEEAFAAYGLFRRSLSEAGMRPDAPLPPHMEFLIDRQGYIRARWIAQENTGWANTDILLGEIAQLNQEKPSAPAPEDHVH